MRCRCHVSLTCLRWMTATTVVVRRGVHHAIQRTGTAKIWPYLKSEQVDAAFSIADQDKGGEINWEEFQGFLRCTMYLNKHRHIINDLQESFSSEGLSDDDLRARSRRWLPVNDHRRPQLHTR